LVLFSIEDCSRSIPSLVDGLKPSQRKILFCCIKRNLQKEIRVAQLSGYVSEKAAYHHGEASLQSTIVGMAQNFVGSNNLNLLHPQGQFGTRLEGGKDAASARYIHTFLSGLSRAVFNPSDDNILTYLKEEGLTIEPEWYIPVIPYILVNGGQGIGTGYSTFLPNYNPRDIVHNIFRILAGNKPHKMIPWYRGYQGQIIPNQDKRKKGYVSTSNWRRVDDQTLEITELPIGVWTVDFKSHLESLSGVTDASKAQKNKEKATKSKKKAPQKKPTRSRKLLTHPDGTPFVKEYRDYNTDTKVHFIITVPKLKQMGDKEIESVFGLNVKMSIENFHLFDEKGKIQKYKSVDEILRQFCKIRSDCYQKRKDYMVDQLNKDWKKLSNKVRFVSEVVAEQLVVRNRKKKELTAELLKRGYDRFPDEKKTNKKKKKDNDDDEEDQSEAEEKTETTSKKPPSKVVVSQDKIKMDNLDKDYDYLLSMKIWSLTAEYIELLKKKLAEKKEELDNLASRTPRDMWEEDLDYFMELWDVFEKDLNEFENNVGKIGKKRIKMPTQQANARAKAKERALQRAKDRENGKEEMSVDRASEEESVSVVKKDTSRTRSKTLGSKTQGPKSLPVKSNTTHTKVTLKKKDEIQNKKGTRTLHDYFSMETSNSTSGGSPKKNSKSKKEKSVSEKSKKPPAKKTELSKSQVAATTTKDNNTKKPPAKRTQSTKRKSESSDYTDAKTLRSDKSEVTTQNKTKRSESDSVYDSKDGGDSGDDAESESSSITDDSDLSSRTPKKPVTRKNAKQPGKKPIKSDSDDD